MQEDRIMSFEQQFPSYNKKEIVATIIPLPGNMYSVPLIKQAEFEEYLRLNCLDKQRVREAINELLTLTIKEDEITCKCASCAEEKYLIQKMNELKLKLGLENEE